MTDLTFEINGVSYADCVHKYGYETDRTPVYSRTVTDLDGVEHDVLLRTRGTLSVTINDLAEERSSALCAALRATSLRISYHSFQLGADVTEDMKLASLPRSVLFKLGATRWIRGQTLTFVQR